MKILVNGSEDFEITIIDDSPNPNGEDFRPDITFTARATSCDGEVILLETPSSGDKATR